jgi:hypothetical protein
MAKLSIKNRKKSLFYEEKSLVGLTPGLVSQITPLPPFFPLLAKIQLFPSISNNKEKSLDMQPPVQP